MIAMASGPGLWLALGLFVLAAGLCVVGRRACPMNDGKRTR